MRLRGAGLLFLLPVGSILISGCGMTGGVHSIPPVGPTAVIFSSVPPASLAVQAKATLTAAAIYSNSAQQGSSAVTWSVSCGSVGACGTFGPSDNLAGTTYTAPSAVPSGGSVIVTATSVADATKSASTTIKIVPPIPISVAFFAPPPASLQVGAVFAMSASIANDVSANPQVKWTVACGSGSGSVNCGSFSAATTGDEQGNSFTAPATIPSGGTVTVTVTSLTDTTKTASTAIVITAPAATLADGTYVFQLGGAASYGPSFTTGVFTAKGGNVLGGEQDSIAYTSDADNNIYAFSTQVQLTGGSYAPGPDGNLQVSLMVGPNALETIGGTMSSGSHGLVGSLNGAPSTGMLDLQTSTVTPAGGFAIALSGGDQYANLAWIGGVLNVDGAGSISGNGSSLDVIDGQAGTTGSQTVGASTISSPDANGRFLLTLNPGTGSVIQPIYLVGYVIDATHMRLIETGDMNDNTNFKGVLGGSCYWAGKLDRDVQFGFDRRKELRLRVAGRRRERLRCRWLG